ncbi:beta-1,3-galactosyltransferase 5 [Agrilus planipennis]|uniref:Hexosyltransferase n=1 Tax=Agrilus planipennis TaxID=224129 RepID=A0A1W4W4G2_AGRPL|nr:beta-1,3-galactosyltransferase 5 [Agrilus planipennis]
MNEHYWTHLSLKKQLKVIVVISIGVSVFVIIVLYSFGRENNSPIVTNNPRLIYSNLQNSMPALTEENKYVLAAQECNSKNKTLLALILVTSYYGNVETRSAMRRAFSSLELENMNMRRVFLLAVAKNDKYTNQGMIENEQSRFGDLLQGNFIESYRNLTYKHLMGLKWAAQFCASAKYVVKMDDDIVVNVYRLKKILVRQSKVIPKRKGVIAGYLMKNMVPIRDPHSKWYVSQEEYDVDKYPAFVSGWLYITNTKTITDLLAASKKIPYFWIDDLYITGILAQIVNITFIDLSFYFTTSTEELKCCIDDYKKYKYDCDYVIGPNGGDNNLFFEFNEIMKKCYTEEGCSKKVRTYSNMCGAPIKTIGGEAEIEKYKLF